MIDRSTRRHVALRVGAVALFSALAVACGGGGGGGGSGPAIAVDLASVMPSPVEAATRSGAGDFAADYLRDTNFSNLEIEIDYPEGRSPSSDVVTLVQQRMSQICGKLVGVLVDEAIPRSEFPPVVTIDDLDDISAAHRSHFSDLATQRAAIYVLYVPGKSDLSGSGASTQILGLTYHGGSVALFIDAADRGSDPFITTAEVEGEGLIHELGHTLGLTGATIPMVTDHRDAAHGWHDVDATAVMHWLIQVPQFSPNLGDADFAQYDSNSLADIAAFVGSAVPAHVSARATTTPESLTDLVGVGACATCAATDGHTCRR